MIDITEDEIVIQLTQCLSALNIVEGDHVLVHSSLAQLIYVTGIYDARQVAQVVHRGMRRTIGERGVIATLSATWETARDGLDFHVESTPVSKDLGLFPEYLRSLSGVVRTDHPVFSLCFEGEADHMEDDVMGHLFAFGATSPWATMLKRGYKILFFGLGTLKQMSLVHHAEQLVGVPYCYNKVFPGKVWRDGVEQRGPYIYNVPYRQMGIEYSTMDRLKELLVSSGALRECDFLGVPVMSVGTVDAFNQTSSMLKEDCYSLLVAPPCYSPFQPPIDRY